MRVLAVSDVVLDSIYSPALREIARSVDLCLSCGDLPSYYLEYILSTLDVPVYYVMGNHGSQGGEREFPEGCENIDGRVVENKGLLIAGLEGSRRYNDRPRYQYTERQMQYKIGRLASKLWMNRVQRGRYLDMLVTHSPPYSIHDGSDLAHQGFKSFLWLIDHFHPDYLIHGHTHIYDSRAISHTTRGHTLIINAYGYKIIEVPSS